MLDSALFLRLTPLIFTLLWSSGWIVAGYSALYADALTFLVVRYACAALAITALALAMGAPWPKGRRAILDCVVTGVLIHAAYLGGVWWAVRHGLPAGISGLIAGLQPILTALFAPMLIGVTFGSFYQKARIVTADLRTVTALQYIAALAVTLPLAFALEPMRIEWNLTMALVLAWSVLALSLGGIGLYLMMIRRGAISRVSTFLYLVPALVAVEAWILFGETLTPIQIAGMALTIIGVALASRK
ncbi:MAG: hypothetical protein B7Z14_06390 [Bosea sp. 32-68-6]|nr:MAG: hypothetical protein B7Z14_06390 [Bosea sp. 32-68-6]